MFIISVVILIILNVIEAKLQSVIIKEFTEFVPPDKKMQNVYHNWFSIYYSAFVIALILVGHLPLIIIPIAFFSRRLFFQELLNIFRGLKFGYLSDRGMDKIEQNILGKNAGKINAILCVIIIAACIIFSI
jgi:hypothetical protein